MPETQTLTLTTFLLARIAEDEANIKTPATFPGDSHELWICDEYGHVAVDPTRVLAECEAKRETIRLAVDYLVPYTGDSEESLLRHLALPYVDHPDFRAEWAL